MNLKIILDVAITASILLWPVLIIVSIMAFDAPGSMNKGYPILISVLLSLYPVIVFLIYTLFFKRFLVFPSVALLAISFLICFSAVFYLGQVKAACNYLKGIKNEGYTVTESKVFFNGSLIKGADSKTFSILENGNKIDAPQLYSRDQKTVYFKGVGVEHARSEGFTLLEQKEYTDPDAFDGESYFLRGKLIKKEE